MYITVNGKKELIAQNDSVIDFIISKELNPDKLIIELNMQILSKKDWGTVILKEKDNLEILGVVSGG
ncbi:MAG: sulfur carrier protein ThiS [Bacteroidetes bacterium]|nr:sulfur carrier protein ThiS [Bacteroidota bacterium]